MTNTTNGAISLQPTGNAQGGHHFMSLTTGRRLTSKLWTILPVPQDVLDRVHNLARKGRKLNDITFEMNTYTLMLKNSAIDAITAGVSEDDNLTYQYSDSGNDNNLSDNSSDDSENIESDNDADKHLPKL